ncbi:hypothetical protein GMST_15070 [Geomonas silvestris]|uniref:Lipoprotein n=1 Tax=Geomonas silvestris TaxID=2740184 RepID=A0A6V8MGU6_9BACT|nr:hypothetical protein [Geomonas silvestris]GFO59182.1 hypothetical protein GMST_15070 [Geomonas silvestris]
MRKAIPFYLLLSLLALCFLYGCGGGSGGGAASTPTVSGTVFAGPVTGTTLTVKDTSGNLVAGPFTVNSSDGSFQVPVPGSALSRDLIFQATGGSYTDEATGTSGVSLGSFSAFVAAGSASGSRVTLDPASTIIQKLVARGMTLTAAKLAFQQAFGFVPDSSVAPVFANISCNAPTASRVAGVHAAYFSQLTKDLALAPGKQSELVEALAEDLADGTLDGRNGAAAVTTASGTPVPEDVGVAFATAAINYESGSFNKSKVAGSTLEPPAFSSVSLTPSYRVDYIAPAGGDVAGKDTFQFQVTKRSDGSPALGLASQIALTPLMVMGTMSSSSTWANAVTETRNPGVYAGTVYYSMATTGIDMYWKLSIVIGTETATFYPNVKALPAGNTISAKLANSGDKVGATNRTYRIWRDTLSTATGGSYDLTVFVSSTDAGLALPVYAGQQWTQPQLTLGSVEVAISSDGSTWTALAPVGTTGRYTAAGLAMTAGTTAKYYLRLTINGTTYTTNGNAPDGNSNPALSNGFAAFSVTP